MTTTQTRVFFLRQSIDPVFVHLSSARASTCGVVSNAVEFNKTREFKFYPVLFQYGEFDVNMNFFRNLFGLGPEKGDDRSREGIPMTTKKLVVTKRAQPLLQDCSNGPVNQGFEWYSQTMSTDDDGDAAHGFLREEDCHRIPAEK